MKKKIICSCLIFLLFSVAEVFSHPHVFIANRFAVVFDDKGLKGVEVNWIFDKMFSAVMISDYDRNKNGTFEKSEIKSLEEEAFKDIKEYGYFVSIHVNDKEFKAAEVENFSASIKENAMSYRFLIPCPVKAEKKKNVVVIAPYDPTLYIAIGFPEKNAIRLEGADRFKVQHHIGKCEKIDYPNSLGNPSALFLTFQSK